MNSDCLRYRNRDPLFGLSPEALREALSKRLRQRAKAAYLFGSAARRQLSKDSDVDIIIIFDTKAPFTRRFEDFLDLKEILPSLDILVYTPEEFEKLISTPTIGFWQSVVKDLEKLPL